MCRSKEDGGRRCSGSASPKRTAVKEKLMDRIASLTEDEQIELARDTNTSPRLLSLLYSEGNFAWVRNSAAKNPNIPEDILKSFFTSEDEWVRANAAANPATPPEILSSFASDEYVVLLGLADNTSTPKDTLIALSKHDDRNVRSGVSQNPSTPPEILNTLASDFDGGGWGVWSNPSTPIETLVKGMTSQPNHDREEISENPTYIAVRDEIAKKLNADALPAEWRDKLIDTELDRRFGSS